MTPGLAPRVARIFETSPERAAAWILRRAQCVAQDWTDPVDGKPCRQVSARIGGFSFSAESHDGDYLRCSWERR